MLPCASRFFAPDGLAVLSGSGALRIRQDAFKQGKPVPSIVELAKMVITEAKKTPERGWLGEVSAVVLQSSLRDLQTAYGNFFASKKGTRKGPKIGPPRFKMLRRAPADSCGALTGPKGTAGLKVRVWACDCGTVHDRDRNAECNLRAEGRRMVAAGRADT
ncbi:MULTISPECIES: hypothetical protein [unclassified Streptomyces]|uniref:hypothetical protein n=1 Tax=unclassified Streptomyces TaxID=2593676 RepID=UPI003369FC82